MAPILRAGAEMRMLLLDAADSAYSARIEHAANDAGLSVQRLDSLDAMPADAPLIGVGPSISDPLDVARQAELAAEGRLR